MLRAVALATSQLSVALWPALMLAGAAVKWAMAGGCGAGLTVTVAVAVVLPAALPAVSV